MRITHSLIRPIFVAMFGFFAAELVLIFIRTPSLLDPSHLAGIWTLTLSGLILYAVMGFLYFGFSIFIVLIGFLFRRPLTGEALVITTLYGAPFIIIFRERLHNTMFGTTYFNSLEPKYYLPFIASLLVLSLIIYLTHMIVQRKVPIFSFMSRYWSNWLLFLCCMIIYFLVISSGSEINVLGVFDQEKQRNVSNQLRLEETLSPSEDAPNIIILMIECFRRDEFTAENAPFLWTLAQENIFFNRYFTVASATRPSVTSFFTSAYPIQHGCYNFTLKKTSTGEKAITKLSDSFQTFSHLFQRHGYRTLMATSNDLTMDPVFAFEEIFHRFDALEPYGFTFPSLHPFLGFHFLKKYLRKTQIFKVILFPPEHSTVYFDAPRVNRTILREMGRKEPGPYFLYAHYMEPHTPYYTHPYRSFQLNLFIPSQRENILEAYRSEIRAVDKAVEELYSELEEKGLLTNTIIFISSDHGEEFLDHGKWGHRKNIYPESLHVPAILVLPHGIKQATTVENIVENIDIAPTLAELAQLPVPESWEGASLIPLFTQEPVGNPTVNEIDSKQASGLALSQLEDGVMFQAGVISDPWQVIFQERSNQERKIMFFNLDEDPQARHNLFGQGLEEENRMVRLLDSKIRELRSKANHYKGEGDRIDKERLDQLRTLGYID